MKSRGLVLIVAALGAAAGCQSTLEQFVLRPSPTFRRTPTDFGYDFKEVVLSRDNNNPISIWHVFAKGDAPRKGIIVLVPGNDANKGRYTVGLPMFCDDGWDVLLMDYPGFGASPGKATFNELIAGTRRVIDYAIGESPVVVGYGVSLGNPVLIRVAADYNLTAVVMESSVNIWKITSTFMTYHQLGSPLFDFADFIAAVSTSDDYDSLKWIKEVKSPKLFLQSPDDNVTPFDGAWEMFKAAPQPKHLIATQGEHALQMFLDPVMYRSLVNGWLDGVLQRDPILNERFQQILDEEVQSALAELGFIHQP